MVHGSKWCQKFGDHCFIRFKILLIVDSWIDERQNYLLLKTPNKRELLGSVTEGVGRFVDWLTWIISWALGQWLFLADSYLASGWLGLVLSGQVCESHIREVVGMWFYLSKRETGRPLARASKLGQASIRKTKTKTYIICYQINLKISDLIQLKFIFGWCNNSVNADDSGRWAVFYVEIQKLVLCPSGDLSII